MLKMATRLITSMLSLLFLARIAMGEPHLAERVPQLLHNRQSYIGGISLYATTPETGEDGFCPSYTQTCSPSCCPDGCCPMGTYCFVNGDYCCPTDADCSKLVDSEPSCANSTWIMYARPSGAASPYFCCEPDQIALLPNLCVPNNGTYAVTMLAPLATQAVGPASSNTPGSSTTTSGTSTSAKSTEASSTGSATPETSGASATESPKPSSTETGTTTVVHETTTQSPSGTSSASSISSPTAGGAESLRSAEWPWGLTVLVVALGFGMRLVM